MMKRPVEPPEAPHHQGPAVATKIQQIPLLTIDGEEAKISVVGEDQHPLYRELTTAIPRAEGDPDSFRERLRSFGIAANDEPDILWNFEKFLVARDGTIVRRFAPSMTPDDPVIAAAVVDELAR